MSNVYDRKKLYGVIIAQSMNMHQMVVKCKCPDWRKQQQARSEDSRCRVRSPLVDLTVRHKSLRWLLDRRTWLGWLSHECDSRTLAERLNLARDYSWTLQTGVTLIETEHYQISQCRTFTNINFVFNQLLFCGACLCLFDTNISKIVQLVFMKTLAWSSCQTQGFWVQKIGSLQFENVLSFQL